MKEPDHAMIRKWFTFAMGHPPQDNYYLQEWYGRFDSPRHVWSLSDYRRRKALKRFFPEKFGGLDKDANLNNPEWQIPKFDKW